MQDQKNRRVRMVVRNGPHGVEAAQIILVRGVVSVPRDDIERRMIHPGYPEPAREFAYKLTIGVEIFVASARCLEIARIGKPVRADGPEFRKLERGAEILTDVTARDARGWVDAKPQTARDDGNFLRFDMQPSEFRVEVERAKLRHDEHFAIGAVEKSPAHGSIGGVHIDSASRMNVRRSIPGHGHESVDE